MQNPSDLIFHDSSVLAIHQSQHLLTLNEAARLLGISKTTLRRWTRNGTIDSVRINARGDRRFLPEQIENFLLPKIHPQADTVAVKRQE